MSVILALQLAASAVGAQARLSGVVRDSAGVAVANAEISVQDAIRKATSNRRGEYQLSGIRAGTVTVLVRRIGFAPYTATLSAVEGDNRLDVVLAAVPQELDTLATREQQLWREYPLLREFEEHRKVGLGQFVTREQLNRLQGGFINQVFDQMRGITVVRSQNVASHAWLANRYIPSTGCVQLEDRASYEVITPKKADCDMCYPDVYIGTARISSDRIAPNISQFSPDQLQAIEVYLGAAETPARYANPRSGCGVIVLHPRVVELKPRVIASRDERGPTRSRLLVTASISAGKPGAACPDCETGSAVDGSLGYTIRDRWVIVGRYARWKAGSAQSMTIGQALVEWYPQPDPGRFKWFLNAGGGRMSVALYSKNGLEYTDEFTSSALPNIVAGTGFDIALFHRFVVTPFLSYTRTIGGRSKHTHCENRVPNNGPITTDCYRVTGQPYVFNLTQVGTRLGWR